MCAVNCAQISRVKRSLAAAMPACSFDDDVIEYFAKSLDASENLSAESLEEQWSPFLIAGGACADEDEISNLCRTLLQHLLVDDFAQDLDAWLEKLCFTQYAVKARAWCKANHVCQLSEVFTQWEKFADDLSLKPLERKRLLRYVTAQAATPDANLDGAGYPTGWKAASPALPAPVLRKAPLQPGATIGPMEDQKRYLLLEELGSGATAVVHKCSSGNKILAVKTISLSKLRRQRNYQQTKDKLQREISILFSLQHPRIVSLHDVVEEPEHALHLVMELVEGKDMYHHIVQHHCFAEAPDGTKPLARYVFAQIADGLRYIHSKDIVHRDLKPENILVDEKSSHDNHLEIKLSDFGHSKLIDGYSLAMTAEIGTPQYWAPEVSDPRKAARGYNQQVDLWSLGVVLYVMLVGSYPFQQFKSIEDQVKNARFSFQTPGGAEVSLQAQNLITSLIKVSPGERLPLAQCLSHPWVEAGGASSAEHPSLNEGVPRQEVRVELPTQPTKAAVQALRKGLLAWTKKFCCSAIVKHQELIVNYGDMEAERRESAQVELFCTLKEHFPSLQLPPGEEG